MLKNAVALLIAVGCIWSSIPGFRGNRIGCRHVVFVFSPVFVDLSLLFLVQDLLNIGYQVPHIFRVRHSCAAVVVI